MTDVSVPQGRVLATVRESTSELRVPQGTVLTAYNVPAVSMSATQATLGITFRQDGDIQITQARVLAAVRGRTSNPTVRAWTYTMDGHDFYILRLGNFGTLVYDVLTEEWYEWDVAGYPILPLSTGINWYGADALAGGFGSNVLCGDDSFGSLYFLDPTGIYDDDPLLGNERPVKFNRVVQGQLPIRSYDVIPCFGVALFGDIGEADEALTVTLELSDDAGVIYTDQGPLTLTPGDYVQRIEWRSLGSMTAPGRLFRILDDGAFARIDGLELLEADDGAG